MICSIQNTLVKVMKYYAGAEVCGQVTMSDNGQPLSDVRILLERDAYSGEDEIDRDSTTYWMPLIGYTDTDEDGNWCFTAPAGKIRASAYAGEFSETNAKDAFLQNEYVEGLEDLTIETNVDRETNLLTALLGKVANMTWMGEIALINITGQQADRLQSFDETFNIAVDSSESLEQLAWIGNESFEGDALDGIDFVLKNIWDMTGNYTLTTSSGSFTTDEGDTRIVQGSGEVTFIENGTFNTQNPGIVRGFTGTFTRTVDDGRTYTASAQFTGAGTIVATSIDYEHTILDCEYDNESVVPELPTFNETIENETVTLRI